MAKGKTKKEEPELKEEVKPEEQKEEPKVAPAIAPGPKKIKVTPEELQKLQADGKLIGWNPATGEALIK